MSASGVVTVIQARRGSTRLPGKVLLRLGGRTVLERMLERVTAAALCGEVVVATTRAKADDEIRVVSERMGVRCYRGLPTDLLDRHYQAAVELGAEHVVKIPSDCPLIDPAVIDRVIGFYFEHLDRCDYVSNLHPPTYPDGNDVEICSFVALTEAWRESSRPCDREHTTPFLWDQPQRFRIGNVLWETGNDLSHTHRVVLDYPEDYEVIRCVFDALHPSDPMFGVDDVVGYLDAHPRVAALNAKHRGTSWYQRHAGELWTLPQRDRAVPEGSC
jgi:spore coat polysaccharide biosynthesis protein SpsF